MLTHRSCVDCGCQVRLKRSNHRAVPPVACHVYRLHLNHALVCAVGCRFQQPRPISAAGVANLGGLLMFLVGTVETLFLLELFISATKIKLPTALLINSSNKQLSKNVSDICSDDTPTYKVIDKSKIISTTRFEP